MAPVALQRGNGAVDGARSRPHSSRFFFSLPIWTVVVVVCGIAVSGSFFYDVLHIANGRDVVLEFLGFRLNAGRTAFHKDEARLTRTCSFTLSLEPPPPGVGRTVLSPTEPLRFNEFVVHDASSLTAFVDSGEGYSATMDVLQDVDVNSLPLLYKSPKPTRMHLPRDYKFSAEGQELLPCLSTAVASAVQSTTGGVEEGSTFTVFCCAASAFGPLGFSAWAVQPNTDVVIRFSPLLRDAAVERNPTPDLL